MADRLRFHRLVASDLREAIQWYDDISAGLGNRFREMVDKRFDEIADHPERFARAFGEVRFAHILQPTDVAQAWRRWGCYSLTRANRA
jgi:hypothetical protein